MNRIKCMNWMFLFVCVLLLTANIGLSYVFRGQDATIAYVWTVLIVEVGVIGLPALWYVSRFGKNMSFGLNRISIAQGFWSVLLGIGAFFLATGVNALSVVLFEDIGFSVPTASVPMRGGGWMLLMLITVGVIPAITEELLLRGVVLHSFLSDGKWRAVFRTSLLFALMHFKPYSIVSLFLMGVLLALVTIETRSCYTGMLVHFTNNIIVATITMFTSLNTLPPNTDSAVVVPPDARVYIGVYLLLGLALCVIAWSRLKHASAVQHNRDAAPAMQMSVVSGSMFKQGSDPAVDAISTQASNAWPLALCYGFLALANGYVLLTILGVF